MADGTLIILFSAVFYLIGFSNGKDTFNNEALKYYKLTCKPYKECIDLVSDDRACRKFRLECENK